MSAARRLLFLLCALACACGSNKSPQPAGGTDAGTHTCIYDDAKSTFDGPCVMAP